MEAQSKGILTPLQYQEALIGLIQSNIEFLSISTDGLVYALQGTQGHELPEVFEQLSSRIGGRKADLLSHSRVSLNTVFKIWENQSLSPTLRQAVAGRLLNNLIRYRSLDQVRELIAMWVSADLHADDPIHYPRIFLPGSEGIS